MSMLYFPQLSTGAMSQYPLKTVATYRTIVNTLEDGSRIVLADPTFAAFEWELSYSGITDSERDSLAAFFSATEGRLGSFTFFDPAGNLLRWSEALDQAAWQKNSLLELDASIPDPLGTQRATRLDNSGAGILTLEQELSVPGAVTCCFSFYARGDNPQAITLTRTSSGIANGISAKVGPSWERFVLSSSVQNGADTSVFQVSVSAGESIDIFGLQVDAQPGPSQYVTTTAISGVYTSARFDMDDLTIVSTAPNQNSCQVRLITHVNG